MIYVKDFLVEKVTFFIKKFSIHTIYLSKFNESIAIYYVLNKKTNRI